MEINKRRLLLVICLLQLYKECSSQGLQQLSYANADIGVQLIRSTTSTTESPSTTTVKSSFFSGIRNIFGGKKSTTEAPATTTTTTKPNIAKVATPTPTSTKLTSSTTTTTTIKPNLPPVAVTPKPANLLPTIATPTAPNKLVTSGLTVPTIATQAPSTNKVIVPSVPTIPTPTPTKSKIKEDFPALPPPRRPQASGVLPTGQPATVPTTTLSSVWSTAANNRPNNGQSVNFIPRPSTTANPLATTPSSTATATNAEIETLTETLFTKESLNLFNKITIDYQGRTSSSALTDEAPKPLFTIDDSLLDSITTIQQMRVMYNNYELDTMVNEYVTPIEKKEENEFVDTVMATPVMRAAMSFLQLKGLVTPDPKTHREFVKTLWFSVYSRGSGKIGSSAFEHVFLTEIKNNTISGLHNWVYFHDEEKAGHLDYKGYTKKLDLGTKGAVLKFRSTFNNINKPVNSMFIGTSPELEMALYTVCFALRADTECPISLGGKKLVIRTYTFRYRGKNLIGSAFGEI